MRRREFLGALSGAAVARPLAARAQQSNRLRRVGILMPFSESDTAVQIRVRAFKEELQRLGWIEGSQVDFDVRWTTDNMDLVRANAASLVDLKPDIIVTVGNRVVPILKEMTREVPIVFAGAIDPVGTGLVVSLARPGGNITGFSVLEGSVISKTLDVLKRLAPNVSRIALIYNPDNTAFFERPFKTAAPLLAVEPIVAHIHGIADFERVISEMAKTPNTGILIPPDVTLLGLREKIVAIVARSRQPAIYSDTNFTRSGGLASYSADRVDLHRKAASYVDRVLRGAKPSDLPVQEPTKYEFIINLKTAKALGLTVPDSMQLLADELIE
jgi:putative ABC transport system substrate-binding protein